MFLFKISLLVEQDSGKGFDDHIQSLLGKRGVKTIEQLSATESAIIAGFSILVECYRPGSEMPKSSMSDEESPVNFHKTAREKTPKGLELDTQLPWYMLPLFTTTTISVFSLRRRSITCSAEVEVGTQRGGPLAIES
jgi:hypothetical protein